MRQMAFAGGTAEYPDSVVYAYNPNYIRFSGLEGINSVHITFKDATNQGTPIDIYPSLISGSGEVFISKFLQIVLQGRRYANLSVTLSAGSVSANITLQCVSGTLGLEDTGKVGMYEIGNNVCIRRVRCFKNFPFLVSVLRSDTSELKYRIDSSKYEVIGGFVYKGLTDLDPSLAVSAAENTVDISLVPQIEVHPPILDEEVMPIIPMSLDDDTDPISSSVLIRLTVDKSKDGHYFRWVDPQGQLQYFLFCKGTENTKVSDAEYIEEEIEAGGAYLGKLKRTIGKTRTRELKCCAVNLNEYEQEYVKTIASATDCDMYLGVRNGEDVWMPVNVKAGTFSLSEKDDLQDFEIIAELPISQTQTR